MYATPPTASPNAARRLCFRCRHPGGNRCRASSTASKVNSTALDQVSKFREPSASRNSLRSSDKDVISSSAVSRRSRVVSARSAWIRPSRPLTKAPIDAAAVVVSKPTNHVKPKVIPRVFTTAPTQLSRSNVLHCFGPTTHSRRVSKELALLDGIQPGPQHVRRC
jgi:hypothetical protein